MLAEYELIIMCNNKYPYLKNSRSGAAYILALTTLLVGTTLALAMLRAGGSYFIGEDTRQKKQAAVNMAEAGIDYAFWQVHYNAKLLPYSADVTLNNGSFHVDITDDGNRERSTMLITSKGTSRGYSYTIKRVTLGPLPYHYAMCENRSIFESDSIISTGTSGGIRANGQISMDSFFNNVTTGGWATTTITNNGTLSPKYPNSPPIAYPSIDYNYYDSIANYEYYWDTTFTSLNCPDGTVIYVNGRVFIRGTYTGACTIVATGDINVYNTLIPTNTDSHLALITNRRIIVDPAATPVKAILYCHNSGNTGQISLDGTKSVTGSVAADDITTDHAVTLYRNSKFNLAIMKLLHLPGL